MNRKLPRISETEWEVMEILWRRSPRSAGEIIASLQAKDDTWHEKTVKTLLNRLVKKRVLGYQKDGRAYQYLPLRLKADYVQVETKSFLDRVFGGALQPLLAHFVEHQQLSPAEVAELKRLLKNKENQ